MARAFDLLTVIRREAIELNRSFVQVPPLVGRIRRTAMNARLVTHKLGEAGAPFDIVARALGVLGDELAKLIGTVELTFTGIVDSVASIGMVEDRLRVFELTLAELDRREWCDGIAADALETGFNDRWRMRADACAANGEAALWNVITAIRTDRDVLLRVIGQLELHARELSNQITAVETAARVESFFIGVNAKVEAVRLDDRTLGLEVLASDISGLCRQVASTIDVASAKARNLIATSLTLISPLRTELRTLEVANVG
ncbi:MAG: hypothetical protein AB7Q27_07595 [Acidimicrobiia bacterium]